MKCSNIFFESKLLMRVKWKFLHLFRYCSESAFKEHNNPNTPDEMLRYFPTQKKTRNILTSLSPNELELKSRSLK